MKTSVTAQVYMNIKNVFDVLHSVLENRAWKFGTIMY